MPKNVFCHGKTITCVYQDCVMCGDKGKKLRSFIDMHGLNVRKISFASEEGGKLVKEAVFEHKIGTMPFFTDGVKFSTSLADFIKKPEKKSKKTTKKVKEGGKNGDN